MDRIITSCQRPNLAAKATYRFARGGTDIAGPTIRLMEVVAQQWGNVEWGFRELQRFPGRGRDVGESIVEAFAWDLETNAKRRIQFTVKHYDQDRKKPLLTSQRDIYEYVANQAQRRVRTCLENIIPRDIVDAAREECVKTLKAKFPVTPENIAKLLEAFENMNVAKAAIEKRLQRRIEAMTSAQFLAMRQIWTSIHEGMSEPGDWFDVAAGEAKAAPKEEEESAIEKAKKEMRQRQKSEAGAAAEQPPGGTAESTSPPAAASTAKKAETGPPPGEEVSAAQQEQDPQKAARDAREMPSSGTGAVGGAPAETPSQPAPPVPSKEEASGSPQETPPEPATPPAESAPDPKPPAATEPGAPAQDDKPVEPGPPAAQSSEMAEAQAQAEQWLKDLTKLETIRGLKEAVAAVPPTWPVEYQEVVRSAINAKIDVIRSGGGARSNL